MEIEIGKIKDTQSRREHGDIEKPCFICGENKLLIEHHICYQPEKTVFICKKCHGLSHTQVTQFKNFRSDEKCGREYRLMGWSVIFPDRISELEVWAYGFKKGVWIRFDRIPGLDFNHITSIQEDRLNINERGVKQLIFEVANKFNGEIYAY